MEVLEQEADKARMLAAPAGSKKNSTLPQRLHTAATPEKVENVGAGKTHAEENIT